MLLLRLTSGSSPVVRLCDGAPREFLQPVANESRFIRNSLSNAIRQFIWLAGPPRDRYPSCCTADEISSLLPSRIRLFSHTSGLAPLVQTATYRATGARLVARRWPDVDRGVWHRDLPLQSCAMGAVSALHETSVLFAVLIGWVFPRESVSGARWLARTIVAAGAVRPGR
jgi:hypothetical protein